ncbi:hypothetical protein [Neptuniibacter sp.]|uniref:hypothetical protein n=1 Tax=Neptuniibacter sp. TaxID=1962643 RepID=UPI003B5B4E69
MDMNNPSSEKRPISSLCVLKRKLKYSRRVHTQSISASKTLPEKQNDQKARLADLVGKIRNAQQNPKRSEGLVKRDISGKSGKVVKPSVVK